MNSLAIYLTVIAMILQILQNATMMEVIVVDLMSTQDFVMRVSAMKMLLVSFQIKYRNDQCLDCVCHEGGAPAIDTSCNHLFPYYQTPNAERKEFINISKVVHYIFDIQ